MNASRTAFFHYLQRCSLRAFAFFGDKAKALAPADATYGEPELSLDDESKTAELRIYTDILPQMYCDWLGMGVSDTGFVRALDRIPKGYKATVRINSNGGDVTVGVAIANRLREAQLPVVIDGVAASIASIIAAASPHVTMKAGATVMLHNPWSCICGNARAMRAEAGVLDTLRDAMLDVYHGKSGDKYTREAWAAALDGMDGADGTWWTGDQAVASGFADVYENTKPVPKEKAKAILEERRLAAAVTGVALPKNLEEGIAEPNSPVDPASNPPPAKSGPAGAKDIKPSVRVSNRPGAFRIPR
jgi:ATP-dependent Clp protease protease subunit